MKQYGFPLVFFALLAIALVETQPQENARDAVRQFFSNNRMSMPAQMIL